jgi:hypothetical protein
MADSYILAPTQPPPWRWHPDDLAARLRRRWPRMRVRAGTPSGSATLLDAMVRDDPPIRSLGVALQQSGSTIVLDPAGPADAVEFTLWYLAQLPGFDPPVHLTVQSRPAVMVVLGRDTTAEQLLTALAPPDVARPAHQAVGALAAAIGDRVGGSPWWLRLCTTVGAASRRWVTLTGAALVATLDLDSDAEPLLREAARLLALRAAVHELTSSDQAAATLAAPPPVDDAVRALLTEHTLCQHLADNAGIRLVAQTTAWTQLGWQQGNYTHHCYHAAWGEPDPRFWMDTDEARRRRTTLTRLYADIGVHIDAGRHTIRFERHPDPSMVAI